MADSAASIAAAVLAFTFGWAALAKLLNLPAWRASLDGYGLPRLLMHAAVFAVPAVEAATAALLLALQPRAGAALSLAMIAAFSLALARAHSRRGDKLPCGCFGRVKARDFKLLLARNAVLGALAGTVLVAGDAGGAGRVGAPGADEIVPAALVTVGSLLLAWTVWQVVSALGRGRHP